MSEEDDLILSELNDEELVPQMQDDLYDGLHEEVVEGVEILLERGWAPYRILTEALVGGMTVVGNDFRDGILFVPEVLMAAKAMKAGMAILKPHCVKKSCVIVRLERVTTGWTSNSVIRKRWTKPNIF